MALALARWLGSLLETICKVGNVEGAETFERLPDGLVIDILSRLPPQSFLRCRWVCKHWRALVSSHDSFPNLHHLSMSTTPMLLIRDDFADQAQHLFVFRENNKKKKLFQKLHLRPELMINKHSQDQLIFLYSRQGVLMFCSVAWRSTYYVVNPITQEEVIVRHAHHPGYLFALYFCPYAKQFRLLYAQQRNTSCQYLVYIFKTQRWRKVRSSTSFNLLPTTGYNPPVVNGALHWITHQKHITSCENGIMVFRMEKEEFSAMPHPGSNCSSKIAHQTMTLMVKDDHLFFCNLQISHYIVDMWILEEYETRLWIKTYHINLLDDRIFPFSLWEVDTPLLWEIDTSLLWGVDTSLIRVKLLYIEQGELLIHLKIKDELYLYNLDHRTVKKLELPQQKTVFNPSCTLYYKSFLAIA